MRALIASSLLFVALGYAPRASACSCMKLTPQEGFTSSTAVFTGEVTDIRKNESTPFGGREVTLRVKKLWKGDPRKTIEVHTAGSSAACGYPFKIGETYLVYAVSDEADPMRVSLCSRTAPVDQAKEDLSYLGKPTHTFDGGRGCTVAARGTSPIELAAYAVLLFATALLMRRMV
jgi:hypothetical protein